MSPRTVAYVGNFLPAHSTENHVSAALRSLGVRVVPFQENACDWATLAAQAVEKGCEALLWTRTWAISGDPQRRMLDDCRARSIPTIGYHLDRWWGLARSHQVATEPFFRCDTIVTADGGHPEEWKRAGVNHVWMPPAVDAAECVRPPEFDPAYDYDVAFVGSWQSYHDEWPERPELIGRLLQAYPRRFRPFCCNIRGEQLTNLFATARVIVGDSCLAGRPERYWSDRIPETLGRGGFLIHPDVPGLAAEYEPGVHLVTYQLGDFDQLRALIDYYLAHPIERQRIARAGQAHVKARHTYRHRMIGVLDLFDGLRDLSAKMGPVTVMNGGVTGQFDIRRQGDGVVIEETWHANQYGLCVDDVKDRVVLDVGANIGDFAIWCALAGARHVWAYEPDEANLVELHHNLALNGITEDQVTVVAEAIHDSTGDVWLNGIQGSVRVGHAPDRLTDPAATVVGRHIDEVLLRVGPVAVMKVDCEGCEYRIFRAVHSGRLRGVDRIIMEFHSGPDFGGEGEKPGVFGALVTKLAGDGMVTTMGHPTKGGMLTWTRYGA